MAVKHQHVLDAIRESGKLEDDTKADLVSAIEAHNATFAAQQEAVAPAAVGGGSPASTA
jgi:hypothetical protein